MTLTDPKKACLSNTPLFRELSEEMISEIARDAQYQIVPPHSIVFKESDPGKNFYIIHSGKVRLFKKGRGGDEILFAELGPGDFFGQLALLTDELQYVNVEALEETHLTVLSKAQFDSILQECPSASLAFAKQMSKYLAINIQVIKKKSDNRFQVSRTSWLHYFFIFTLSLLCSIIFNHSNPNGISLIPKLPDSDAVWLGPSHVMLKYSEGNSLIVDARPTVLYDQLHIKGAISIPLSLFDIMFMMEFSEVDKEKEIIVYGRTMSSHYDERLARKLVLRGYKRVMILKGGLSAWKKKGYPVERTNRIDEVKKETGFTGNQQLAAVVNRNVGV